MHDLKNTEIVMQKSLSEIKTAIAEKKSHIVR